MDNSREKLNSLMKRIDSWASYSRPSTIPLSVEKYKILLPNCLLYKVNFQSIYVYQSSLIGKIAAKSNF